MSESLFNDRMPEENLENREPLKTQNMIEESFFNELKKTDKKMASKINEAPEPVASSLPTNTEVLLVDLFDVRDGLIKSFESSSLNTTAASDLATHINKLGSCIKSIGGDVKEFVPLEHISGLRAPDLLTSAQKVLTTTKQCYSLGEITKAEVEDDGQTISINFEGKEGDISYTARGTITASSSWKGNEAIDYIYTAGSGRMSVKAFENNRWADNNEDYNIYWELDEIDLTASQESPEENAGKAENLIEKNIEKSTELKEESSSITKNNVNDEEDDFPIQEN